MYFGKKVASGRKSDELSFANLKLHLLTFIQKEYLIVLNKA